MPLFYYQGYNAQGKRVSGHLESHHASEAKEQLRARNIMPSKIQEKLGGHSKERLKGEQLLTFTMQLSQLINAGMPVYDSLLALEEQYHLEPFHRVILSICEQIKAGIPLSQAMAGFPDTFDRLYCTMIAAGESAGALGLVLQKLTFFLGRQIKLKKDLTTALIYPAILTAFSLLIIGMLMGFVVPSIEGIFGERQLNGFTGFVVGASRFFRSWWWLFFPLLIGSAVFIFFQLKTKRGKEWLQGILLHVPVVKQLVVKTAVSRFCRTMGTLQEGGLTMIDSLRIARAVMNNAILEEEILQAEGRIVEGSSLSAELRRSKWIPHLVPRLLAVGEESGTLAIMLNNIATIYESDIEKAIERLLAILQPIILMVMGVIIGAVLLAILLPLTDMGSFALS